MLYTKDVTLTTTDLTEVVTIPEGYIALWSLMFLSNHGGSTNACTVYVDKASGTDFYIVDDKNVSSKSYMQFSDGIFVLQPGDKIQAQTGSAGNVSVAVTFDLKEAPAVMVDFNGG